MLRKLFSFNLSTIEGIALCRCRWLSGRSSAGQRFDSTYSVHLKLLGLSIGLFLLQGFLYAQTDTPLPPPRALPAETEKAAERCSPQGNCRAHAPERLKEDATNQQLRQELERLRQERERLRRVRNQPILPAPPTNLPEAELLNQRVQRLLMQLVLEGPTGVPTSAEPGAQKVRNVNASASPTSHAKQAPRSEQVSPNAEPSRSEVSSAKDTSPASLSDGHRSESAPAATATKHDNQGIVGKPLAPLELGQSLFRAGNYEAALGAFRLVQTNGLSREDRLLLQYLQAMCLRKLSRDDEATKLYREIANSRSDTFATECAQWQLSHLRWQQATQQRLEQIRSWRSQREPRR